MPKYLRVVPPLATAEAMQPQVLICLKGSQAAEHLAAAQEEGAPVLGEEQQLPRTLHWSIIRSR